MGRLRSWKVWEACDWACEIEYWQGVECRFCERSYVSAKYGRKVPAPSGVVMFGLADFCQLHLLLSDLQLVSKEDTVRDDGWVLMAPNAFQCPLLWTCGSAALVNHIAFLYQHPHITLKNIMNDESIIAFPLGLVYASQRYLGQWILYNLPIIFAVFSFHATVCIPLFHVIL